MDELPPIKRPDIPILKIKRVRKNARNVAVRSYPVGKDDFFRCYKNDILRLEVTFQDKIPHLVKLRADFSGIWEDSDFSRRGESFFLEVPLERCGIVQFKVKYSFNQGTTWFWDNVPYSFVLVDSPNMKNLRLYTLIPTISGKMQDWSEQLGQIKEMGFNAVHLLPITALDNSESPYSAYDLFNIDSSYGNLNDLRDMRTQFEALVMQFRKMDIKLCVDLVVNHVGITSRIAQLYSDWIAIDNLEKDSLKRAGCWDRDRWISWRDLVLLKYDHPNKNERHRLWHYMLNYIMFWSYYANYTRGFIRLDNLHSTDQAFLNFALKFLRQEFPDLVVIGELFLDIGSMKKMVIDHGISLLISTPWVVPYAEQLRHHLISLHEHNNQMRYILPVNSHDSGTPAQEYGAVLATVPRYAVGALMGTGQTGMVQGVEFGMSRRIEFIGRKDRMDMSGDSCEFDFSSEIKKINELMDRYPLLQQGGNLTFIDNNHGAILGAYRYGAHSSGLLIFVNLDNRNEQSVEVDFKKHFPDRKFINLIDYFSGEELGLSGIHKFVFNKLEYRVFTIL